MPRPLNTTRVVMSGALPGGENFAWGFWLTGNYPNQADTQTAALTIGSYFETYALTALEGLLAADGSYQTCTVYSYSAATGAADFVGEVPIAGGVGTSVGASLPLQLALVVTLRTGQAGRRKRGRMYLPVTAQALTAHQMTQAQINAVTSALQDFIQNVDNGAAISGNVCVMSQVLGEKTAVTEITADSRLDVQRRRAASETELYQSSEAIVPS
jgi:hypothetical protein